MFRINVVTLCTFTLAQQKISARGLSILSLCVTRISTAQILHSWHERNLHNDMFYTYLVSCSLTPYERSEKVWFVVFTAVTMNNTVFCDEAPRRSCVDRRFGGTSVHARSTRRHIPEDRYSWLSKWIPVRNCFSK
jgi:hypothetical protein